MSKAKKFVSLLLAAVMMFTMLAGCGKTVEDPVETLPTTDPVTVVTDDTTAATDPAVPETTPEPVTEPDVPVTTPPTTVTEPVTTPAPVTTVKDKNDYTVEDMSATMYATDSLNVRSGPSASFDRIGSFKKNEAVTVTGRASTGWYRVIINGGVGYVSNAYLTDVKPSDTPVVTTDDDDDVIIDDGDDDSNVTIDDNPQTPGSSVSYGNWVHDNGWDYMIKQVKEDRFVTVLNQVMEGIQNLETNILVEPVISAAEAESFANLMLPILAVDYCYVKTMGATTYSTNGALKSVTVKYYVNTKEEADQMVAELRSKADKVVKNLKSSWSDYQKIKYINDWLVLNCTCDQSSIGGPAPGKWESNAYGSIVDGRPTCLGYAKGLFYLLNKAGYDVCFAEGIGHEAKHIWVKVKVGSNWYNIDPTWCDPMSPTMLDPNYIDYSYFLVDDDFMARTHKDVFDMTYYREPAANSLKYNWHNVNGYYATSYSEAEKIIKQATKDVVANANGQYAYVSVKFATKELYDQFSANYKKSAYNSKVLEGITSKYTCGDVLANGDGWVRTYRLVKN